MRVFCSYCRKRLRDAPGGRPGDVSHGMCPECAAYFSRLWDGMKLGEYLDDLPGAIVLMDAAARVLAANAKAGEALGRDPASPRGLLGGEALACARSRLPGGCGKTVHCRECTIRNSVTEVSATGRPVEHVQAFLNTDAGRVPLRISARPLQGLVQVTVEEAGAPEPPEEPASGAPGVATRRRRG